MKKTKSRLIVLVFVFLMLLFGGFSYYNSLLSPADPKGEVIAFVIDKGEGGSSVIDNLEKAKLIKSATAFKLYLKLNNINFQPEAGDFKLSPAMAVSEIINSFKSGSVDKWVTLIEGWRIEEMAEKLNKDLGINSQDFIKAAKGKEGYLFPDTYLFNPEASAETIVSTLRNTFTTRYTNELQSKIGAKGLSAEEGVILASIVEREARSDKVRTEVASILLRRINEDMGLNADATLQYALGYQKDEKTWWKKALTSEDKTVNSPYNSYKFRGLPPAPICNPSLSSLNAVANADPNTPYLYYIHDSKGDTYYGKTLDEHNNNVNRYLR